MMREASRSERNVGESDRIGSNSQSSMERQVPPPVFDSYLRIGRAAC